MIQPSQITPVHLTRRSFLKGGTALAALSTLPVSQFAHAAGGDTIKLALVGCGGRGSGAAEQALNTSNQGAVKLVAMADVFDNRLEQSLKNLTSKFADAVDVPKERQFLGFDSYKQAIALADVVILATPPGFRPMQFEEAVRQGKHVFMEKPVASDPAGVRIVLAAAEEAKKKGLKVGVGLQRRHQAQYIETIQRLQSGAIGDIVATRCYWNGQTPWVKTRADLEKKYGRPLTEMEYQMNNWYYFSWIGGDHIVEQHIHNIDVINWLKNGHPVRAQGMGGAEVRVGADYGEIFDHHAVEFEYEDGSRCYSFCRHIPGCWNSVSEHAQGTKGRADISGAKILADEPWRYKAEGVKNPYQQEHDDLFDAIRNNKEYNEAFYGASSTMTAILGRMATYSGKELEYDAALNSKVEIFPKSLAWDADPGPKRLETGGYPRAGVPGKTKLV